MTSEREDMITNVLILCSHNSARSVLAEGMLNYWARTLGKDVRAFSAGSSPSGRVHPLALDALQRVGIETAGFRSKSWNEFTGPDALQMRVVITVCDRAADEACPSWLGSPVQVYWGYADPSDAPEPERVAAFDRTRDSMSNRMMQLVELPFEKMGHRRLEKALMNISRTIL